MLTAFRTASAIPHYFNPYLEAYARQAWPIERELLGQCTGAYFVEVGPQQRLIQTWAHSRRRRLGGPARAARRQCGMASLSGGDGDMIRSESDRLFQPAPFMPVKNVTDARRFRRDAHLSRAYRRA